MNRFDRQIKYLIDNNTGGRIYLKDSNKEDKNGKLRLTWKNKWAYKDGSTPKDNCLERIVQSGKVIQDTLLMCEKVNKKNIAKIEKEYKKIDNSITRDEKSNENVYNKYKTKKAIDRHLIKSQEKITS